MIGHSGTVGASGFPLPGPLTTQGDGKEQTGRVNRMDAWAILVVISILSVSGLFTLWQTRTSRHDPDWRETLLARWTDEEAIRTHDENESRSRG